MKEISISLVDFALPVPRSGHLEAPAGYGRAAVEGQEIHRRVQRRRAKADPLYQAEVPLSCVFDRQGFRFRIEGRMDGLFRQEPPHIEEIKSSFHLPELARRLAEQPLLHPYGLQLLSYGYFYWQAHQVLPTLSFHLVSTRSRASRNIELPFDPQAYELWLEARLEELVAEARKAQRQARRRRRTAARFTFPFSSPRPGQLEVMAEIEQGMAAGQPLLLQAPTGLGKTVGVLYPVLREALSRGQRVVYVTPKNSQHAVAEAAVRRFQLAGMAVKSLVLTAKAKICFQSEPLCTPEACEFARDYYDKLRTHGLANLLAAKRRLRTRTFRALGEKYRVCPFELQLEGAGGADIVIGDYNYVFAPRSALNRVRDLGIDQEGRPSLVVDEIHNLPGRAMDYYSPSLAAATLEGMRDEIRALSAPFAGEAEPLLDGCLRSVAACGGGKRPGPVRIDPPADVFLEQEGRLRTFLARYLDSGVEIAPRDVLLRLCLYWSSFTEALGYAVDSDRQEFFTTYHPQPLGGTVKITCCDASAMLRECYGAYGQVVGFSATLKPFDYYLRLCGLEDQRVRTAEFASPFPVGRRKLLIIPQVSTRFSHRERNYGRIAEAITRIAALRRGNYFVFLPSFAFLERLAEILQPPAGFTLLKQDRGLGAAGVEAVVGALADGGAATIVLAVQGGSLAEGMDYPGEMVIGAFVVGPPLPTYDLQREQMRAYYQRQYGAGFDYAYVIPAMARAVQAAGRVIRSETDRGLIVLMDDRFLEGGYTRAMPADWFGSAATELVSDSILRDVAGFWSS